MDVLFDTLKWLTHNILNSNTRLKYSMGIVSITLLALLAACGPAHPEQPITPTGTNAPTFTPISPTLTQLPTETPSSTLTPLPPSTLEGLRMAYIIDGNLYVQDSGKQPVQLTHVGKDWRPIFSNNGETILFFRGRIPHELFSINALGGHEQALVTHNKLIAFNLGYSEATAIQNLAFVPDTNFLLFNTGEVDLRHPQTGPFRSNEDLFLIDTSTNEIKVLLSPGKGGNFRISPDENLVAVQAKGHIDIVAIDGQIIRRNLVTYTPTHPYDLKPNFFWNSDSTELIVSLPAREIYDLSGPEAYTIWRYAIDGSTKKRLLFEPPALDDCCVSPDGNWFLYSYYYYPGKTSDEIPNGLYLGNLHDSSTQLYDPYYLSYSWSIDSEHFIYGDNELFLGSINGKSEFIDKGRFLGWLDDHRYLYYNFEQGSIFWGELGKPQNQISTHMPRALPLGGRDSFTFIFLPEANQ